MTSHRYRKIFLFIVLSGHLSGCAYDYVSQEDSILSYQKAMVEKGPQLRLGEAGLESQMPAEEPGLRPLQVIEDQITGKRLVNLALEDAVVRALANSPEIRVVSFDPSIARKDITKAVSVFDVNFFSKLETEKQDNPTDSLFQGGQAESRLLETGLKQKIVTGTEWQLTYALSRSWDDLITRSINTRFEPVLFFQIKQPLLRDAWPGVNLAGVNISRLNYRASLAGFRQKTEDTLTDVVSLYWTLLQSRHDYEIQQWLLEKTMETLKKLEDRRNIDATALQIKQAEASLKGRQAILLQAKKRLVDVQDELVRLLSDHQINLLSDIEILTITSPKETPALLVEQEIIESALAQNPRIAQARLAVEVAEINMKFAKRQKAPRLDLVASTRVQGLASTSGAAHEMFYDTGYTSYTVGVVFEYPLWNRDLRSEYQQRRLEHSKAVSALQNVSDQVTTEVKERIRLAGRAYEEIQVQKDAAMASEIYLQAIEDLEVIREKLTPEFLLVKLQAQESLADARRAEVKTIVEYNIALTRLAQTTSSLLNLRYVQGPLKSITP